MLEMGGKIETKPQAHLLALKLLEHLLKAWSLAPETSGQEPESPHVDRLLHLVLLRGV